MCLHCAYRDPCERPPCQTGLAPLAYVYALEAAGVPRRESLTMTPRDALAALGAAARDRWVDDLIRGLP